MVLSKIQVSDPGPFWPSCLTKYKAFPSSLGYACLEAQWGMESCDQELILKQGTLCTHLSWDPGFVSFEIEITLFWLSNMFT